MKKSLAMFLAVLLLGVMQAKADANIMGQPVATIDRMYYFVKNHTPSFDYEIAKQFYEVGKHYNVRGDIALCQSCCETTWFTFGGGTAVTPDQHNYCGLGVTYLGAKGSSFATVKDGVTAQIQHLYAYACTAALPAGETKLDPRFDYVSRGCAPTWVSLGGRWAANTYYGYTILQIYDEMMAFVVPNPELKTNTTSITLTGREGEAAPSQNVTISGKNLSTAIVYNASSSAFKVTTSNWDSYSGGTLNIALDMTKTPGTYEGYVAVQSGSGSTMQRVTINVTGTIISASTIKPSPTTVAFGNVSYNTGVQTRTVKVTATDLTNDISVSSSNNNFTVTKGSDWNGRTGGTLTISFNSNVTPGSYSGAINLQSKSDDKVAINCSATVTVPALSFSEGWNCSEKKSTLTAKGWDASKIRNMDFGDGRLFCVYNHSDIKVVKAQTGEDLGTLASSGISGGTLKLCDVKYFDGKIVACNLAMSSGETAAPLHVYRWDNTASQPQLILETSNFGGAARIGDCMSLKGDWTNGEILFANDDSSTTRIISYKITNGTVSTTPTVINVTNNNAYLAAGVSARVKPISGGYWIDGKSILPTRLSSTGAVQEQLKGESNTYGNDFAEFTYNGKKYMFVSTYLQNTNTYTEGLMRLYDVSTGYANASAQGDYPNGGLGTTRNINTTGSCVVNFDNDYVEAWILTTLEGIAYYKSGNVPTHPVTPVTPDDPILVSSISIPSASASIMQGNNIHITATVLPDNATNKNVTWSSSNTSVATVNNGIVFGVAAGTAVITVAATDGSGVKATCNVTVTEPEKPKHPTEYTLEKLWSSTDVPAAADARQATTVNGKLYIQDKANKQIHIYDHNGATGQKLTDSGTGTQISSDEAGNIIVRYGNPFPNIWASNEQVKVYVNGNNDNSKIIDLPSALPSVTGERQDFFGKASGDIVNGDAVLPVVNVTTQAITMLSFSNGSLDFSINEESAVQGINCGTVNHIADDVFVAQPARNQDIRLATYDGNNYDDSKVLVTPGRSAAAGVSGVQLMYTNYVAYNIGTNYLDGFSIAVASTNADNKALITKNETATANANAYQTNWVLFAKIDEYKAYVYHYYPGGHITCYLFSAPDISGAEELFDTPVAKTPIAFGGNGTIVMMTNTPASIYSITGTQIVSNTTEKTINVPSGVYIVTSEGKSTKVVVR